MFITQVLEMLTLLQCLIQSSMERKRYFQKVIHPFIVDAYLKMEQITPCSCLSFFSDKKMDN